MSLRSHVLVATALLLLASAVHATDLSGTISTPVVLPAGSNRVVGNVTIAAGASLTLSAGALLSVTGNYGMSVYGSLLANGTSASTCYVGGSTSGSWQGITILTGGSVQATSTTFSGAHTDITDNGGSLSLSGCTVQAASLDGVAVYGSSTVQIATTAFLNITRRGLYLETGSPTGSVGACTFTSIGEYPVLAKAALVPMLGGPFTFTSVADPYIGVSCSADQDITASATWSWLGYDYDLRAGTSTELDIAPGASLTLNPGVRVRGGSILVQGTLTSGGPGAPVYIYGPNGEAGNPGDWPGISTSSGVVSLTNTVVRDAANGLVADGGSVSMTSSSILRSQYYGLETVHAVALSVTGCTIDTCGLSGVLLSSATTGSLATTTVSNCAQWPIYALANAVGVLGSGLSFSNNAAEAIGVDCDLDPDVTTTQTWHAQPVPLDLAGDPAARICAIAPGVGLTLDPGVTLLAGGLDVRGALHAEASAAQPVLLTSAQASPSPGDCLGVTFEAGSTGDLDYFWVDYGQTGLIVTSSAPTLSHVRATHCSQDGLDVSGAGATPVVFWSNFTSNARYGVYIDAGAQPDLGDTTNSDPTDDGLNTLAPNLGAYDVYNASSANIQAQNNWWATTQTATIAARIYDHSENPTYGTVTFLPISGSQPNTPPELAWLGTGAYVGVGLAPQVGTPSTDFVWKILYSDADGNAPTYVRVHVLSDGNEISGSPFALTLQDASPNYTSGATFAYDHTLPVGRSYTYYFDANDGQAAATGAPTSSQAGPVVTNPPTLSWTGQPGYDSGGVSPMSGYAGDTPFVWRVTYTDIDGDAPTGVFVHVLINGTDIPGSPFAMTQTSGSYSTGAIYEVTTTIASASASGITYYFAASDGIYQATGPPASPQQGPSVAYAPQLTFPTETGYELTGVQPAAGLSTSSFHFAVLYSQQGNVAPQSVVVHVARLGVEVQGSPFACSALDSGSLLTGRTYGVDVVLPAAKDYTHWFDATASGISAFGPATKPVGGPVSDRAPSLSYPTSGVGAGTGMSPSSGGIGATQFTWRVVYSDPDGDVPRFVGLRLFLNGTEVPGSPFSMTPEVGGDYSSGKTYSIQKLLSQAGPWQYSFIASDSYFDAAGEATTLRSGPTLSGSFSLAPLNDVVARDGLSPSSGEASDTPFTFAVTYTNPSGADPTWVHVVLISNGDTSSAQTIDLTAFDTHSVTSGRVYTVSTPLAQGDYSYYFEGFDGTNTVRTDEFSGPLTDNRPHLTWVGDTGYVGDGFDPSSGIAGQTIFVFRVRYTDADGDAPVKHRLVVYSRADLSYPFYYTMTPEESNPDYRAGVVFRVATTLGSFTDGIRYRFDFDDGMAAADGDPSVVSTGPTVTVGPLVAPMIYAAHASAGPMLATIDCSTTRVDLAATGVVMNLAGRTIATVAGSIDPTTRQITFAWPYTTRAGTHVPPGMYLFVIQAAAPTGESFRRVVPLMVPRP